MTKIKIPVSETNYLPSSLVEAPKDQGVQSQLIQEQKQPKFNGKDFDTLRDESPLNRLGKFEQVAMAQKLVSEKVNVYNKSGFATQFANNVQQFKKR